ncbi:DUF732 domain-containing protein [Streptomyces sp. SAJ15]|uniref:DUF732 domain-containing protein n=1 Tax=Streptomyces sp. SAJ15 TaxID=2011095 RepID=UPI001185739D|nr:DUF732 domain-containing protein [Streptomyces sp. SAJ15]TVL89792.1 hypothetical protein CD790_25690 [Streptomyces sp. SAJ15]
MRTRTTVAAATLAALLLTGCSDSNTHDKPKTEPKPTHTVSKQDRFLSAVHDADFASWADKGPTDDELLDYPAQWCEALHSGHSVDYIFSGGGAGLYPIGMEWGTKREDANEVLLLAVTAYCPKYRSQVAQDLRASGAY